MNESDVKRQKSKGNDQEDVTLCDGHQNKYTARSSAELNIEEDDII